MRQDAADGFTQLALHVLAHVPRDGPGDLLDRRHVEWSARVLPPRAQALLTADAATLAALWRSDPALDILDALPDLHTSLDAFRRTAARALADLRPADVAGPPLLRALQRLGPAGELMHATLGLLAPAFARVHAELGPALLRGRDELRPWLAALCEHVPDLAAARVELVWALGPRGRALPARLLVGCPGHLTDAATPAIVAAHEHAVCLSGQVDTTCPRSHVDGDEPATGPGSRVDAPDPTPHALTCPGGHHADATCPPGQTGYVHAEWSALARLARWLAPAPAALRDAHARWLASLDLSALLTSACALGLVAPADADALRTDRPARAALLAALA